MDRHSVPRYTLLYELPPECPFATLASSHLGEWPRYLKTRNATSVQGHEMGKVAIAVRGRVSQFICEALALAIASISQRVAKVFFHSKRALPAINVVFLL